MIGRLQRAASQPRARRQAGSVTIWMLGLSVMVLFLGGISLDLWRVIAERRALAGAVDAAAVAGAGGIDEQFFRGTGQTRLVPRQAEALATASVRAQPSLPALDQWEATATPTQIRVRARSSVEFTLLAVLVRGEPFAVEVTASAPPRASI